MVSLIITVLALGLVAVLAFVGLFYGSSMASEAAARARAATLVNQGEQIIGAARLFYVNNSRSPSTLQELVDDGYLQSIPSPVATTVASSSFSIISEAIAAEPHNWTWDASTQTLSLVRAIDKAGVCEQVNNLSFNSAKIQDSVDTRFRVQCYGSPDSQAYTLLWNANVPGDTKTPSGKYALCQGTENIGHTPATCGTGVAEGAPVEVASPGAPVSSSLPVDQIPGLADYLPGIWSSDATDGTCSNAMPGTSALTPLQYVIYSPSEGLATISMSLSVATQNAVDYWLLGYTYGTNTSARVLVDGQEVFNQWLDLNTPMDVITTPTMLTAGTHVVTVAVTADFTLMDGMSYEPLPWTAEVPPPNKKACVKQFQHAIVVKPENSAPVPPAGQLSVSGSCTMDELPYIARATIYNFYCPAPGGTALWGDLHYALNYSNIAIRGTKETLDQLNQHATMVGSVFADGPLAGTPGVFNIPITYLYGECAALGNTSSFETMAGEPIAGRAIRVSDTELWVPTASGSFTRGNQPLNGDYAHYVENNINVPYFKNLNLALLSGGAPSYGPPPPLSAAALSSVACSSASGRSRPLNTWGPSCATGFAWNDTQNKCVCQPSATVVCPTPNAGLPSGATNTNTGVKCTTGTMTNGTCLPWAPAG